MGAEKAKCPAQAPGWVSDGPSGDQLSLSDQDRPLHPSLGVIYLRLASFWRGFEAGTPSQSLIPCRYHLPPSNHRSLELEEILFKSSIQSFQSNRVIELAFRIRFSLIH